MLNAVGFARHWDPYPFILLNLALSFQAAYAAPIVIMSQHRWATKDCPHAEEGFRTNILAELVIAVLQAHLTLLREIRRALVAADG